jgi:hypothetical protein
MFSPQPAPADAWQRACWRHPLATVQEFTRPREDELLAPFYHAFGSPEIGPALAWALLRLTTGPIAANAGRRLKQLIATGRLVLVSTPQGRFGPDAALAEFGRLDHGLRLLVPIEGKARHTPGQACRWTTFREMPACFPEVQDFMSRAVEAIVAGQLNPEAHADEGCTCWWPPELGWKRERREPNGVVRSYLCVPQLVQSAFVGAYANAAPLAVVGHGTTDVAGLSEFRIDQISPDTRGLWLCPRPRKFEEMKQCYGWGGGDPWPLAENRYRPTTYAEVLIGVVAFLEALPGFTPGRLDENALALLQRMADVVVRAATVRELRGFAPTLCILAAAGRAQ